MTACELMEVALDELADKFNREPPVFYCRECGLLKDASEYAECDRANHELTEVEQEPT